MKAKSILAVILQVLAVMVGFLISRLIPNMLLPMPAAIRAAAPASGFLSVPVTFILNGAVNAVLLVWVGRRSSARGLALWAQLLVLSFGAQVFMTQIETAYFLRAFPLLQGNFEIYRLVLRGLLTSLLVTLLVTGLVGGFSKKSRSQSRFVVTNDDAVRSGAWLPVAYILLYLLFGYFVAWQSPVVRQFYSGSTELTSFFAQWGSSFMERPELPVFQYFRGILWLLCLIPLFKGFTGGRLELVILSGLALGLLPTMQLAFANPLMPATVSAYHFVEVAISTGIFGALCAWFVPKRAVRIPSAA